MRGRQADRWGDEAVAAAGAAADGGGADTVGGGSSSSSSREGDGAAKGESERGRRLGWAGLDRQDGLGGGRQERVGCREIAGRFSMSVPRPPAKTASLKDDMSDSPAQGQDMTALR
jgi:hypothetical protein